MSEYGICIIQNTYRDFKTYVRLKRILLAINTTLVTLGVMSLGEIERKQGYFQSHLSSFTTTKVIFNLFFVRRQMAVFCFFLIEETNASPAAYKKKNNLDLTEPGDYWPISKLSFLSKFMEKVVDE